jgi:hypothetical protein
MSGLWCCCLLNVELNLSIDIAANSNPCCLRPAQSRACLHCIAIPTRGSSHLFVHRYLLVVAFQNTPLLSCSAGEAGTINASRSRSRSKKESRSRSKHATIKQAEAAAEETEAVNAIRAVPKTEIVDVALVPDHRLGTKVATEGTIGPLVSREDY